MYRNNATNRTLSRRDFLKVGGAGLAGAALLGAAGCGGSSSGGSGKLVFSMGPDTTGNLQEVVQRFNDQNKGEFQVEYREMPAQSQQYFDQLRTQFQAGGGDIDVIGADVIWAAQFASQGFIQDLSDRFPDSERRNFLPAPVDSLIYDGRIYGVPWFTDAGMLYYRKDLLEKSGITEPPKTWPELKQVAERVKQEQGTKYGFVFQGADYEGGTVNGLEYIWTHGGDILSGDKVIIDSPEAIAGLTTERSMVQDQVTPQAVVNYTELESHATFLNGDAVFIRNWPYMYALASSPEESQIEPEMIDIAPLPVGEGQTQSFSGLGGWNLLVNAASDMQEEAWEFVKFMTSFESQKFRAVEATIMPTLQALYEDREVLDEVPVIALGKEALRNARSRPVSPYYSDMSLEMAEQFAASLKGDTPPEQAAATLQKQLTTILEQAQ